MATPHAERLSQLGSAQQRARVDRERMTRAATTQKEAQGRVSQSQRRQRLSNELSGGSKVNMAGYSAADTFNVLRNQRRVGSKATTSKYQAEEAIGGIDAQKAGVNLEQARGAQMKSAMSLAFLKASKASEKDKEQSKKDAIRAAIRKKVKRTAKATMKRGLAFVIGGIAAVFDMSTWVTTIVDFFYYVAIFAWLNLQMIYGTYMSKGKSFLIDPLDWEPLPLKGVVSPIWLHLALVMADILLILAISAFFGLAFMILVAMIELINDPVGAVLDQFTGASELGPINDIIKQGLGL